MIIRSRKPITNPAARFSRLNSPVSRAQFTASRIFHKKKLTSFVGSGGVVKHEEEKDDDVREIGYTPDEEEDLEPKEKYTPKTPPPKPVKEEGPQLEWVECPFCLAFVEYRGDSCPKCGELWEGEALRVQLKCPKCGKILEKETPSCNCGYKFEK